VLARLETAIEGLAKNPGRGSYPKELLALGIREYRQTFFKPYRMIYRIVGRRVYVYLIADGRRDMQTLLARRLFGHDGFYTHSRGCNIQGAAGLPDFSRAGRVIQELFRSALSRHWRSFLVGGFLQTCDSPRLIDENGFITYG